MILLPQVMIILLSGRILDVSFTPRAQSSIGEIFFHIEVVIFKYGINLSWRKYVLDISERPIYLGLNLWTPL